jgi:hypothetical protein
MSALELFLFSCFSCFYLQSRFEFLSAFGYAIVTTAPLTDCGKGAHGRSVEVLGLNFFLTLYELNEDAACGRWIDEHLTEPGSRLDRRSQCREPTLTQKGHRLVEIFHAERQVMEARPVSEEVVLDWTVGGGRVDVELDVPQTERMNGHVA